MKYKNVLFQTLIKHFSSEITKLDVLEIGFGTGITSLELLSSDARIKLVAIDNEPAMYDKALSKLVTISKERFELKTIDALEYLKSQADNSLDAIISVWVLHNIQKETRNEILIEIYRVLKTNGIFVSGDKIAVSDKRLHQEHLDWQFSQFNVYDEIGRPELKKEWIEHYVEDENPNRILIEDIFLKDLQQIGFTLSKVLDRHYLDAVASAVKP